MEKLTKQELAAYSPWEVKGISNKKEIAEIKGCHDWLIFGDTEDAEREFYYDEIKLILYPLSHLTKPISHKGEEFVPMLKLVDPDNTEWDKMRVESYNTFPQVGLQHDYYRVIHEKLSEIISINPKNIKVLPYHLVEKLQEWHFDTFGLIELGLAIDKSTT